MRAAVLVFMCVIGVTLALPSFRSLARTLQENEREIRIAVLLEMLLKCANTDKRTNQLRSASDDDDEVAPHCDSQPLKVLKCKNDVLMKVMLEQYGDHQ